MITAIQGVIAIAEVAHEHWRNVTAANPGRVFGNPQDAFAVAEHDWGWVHVHYFAEREAAESYFNQANLRRILIDKTLPQGQREVAHAGDASCVDNAIRDVLQQSGVL